MSDQKKKKFWIIVAVIFVAALSRLLPHPANFTPIVAMALFSGAYLINKKHAFIFALGALFISDLLLNNTILRSFYPNKEGLVIFSTYMIWVYGAMLGIVGLAILILKKINFTRVLLGAVSASIAFYIVTNTGAMVYDPVYTKDFTGWSASMFAGLPFFKNALIGNLVYSGVLFGAYELFASKYYKGAIAKQ